MGNRGEVPCAKCRFWILFYDEKDMGWGTCIRYAPTPMLEAAIYAQEKEYRSRKVAVWPLTHESWKCGESERQNDSY